MKPILSRMSICGLTVEFTEDNKKNCRICSSATKKPFRSKYSCGYTLGLGLEDGLYGRCRHYEDKI